MLLFYLRFITHAYLAQSVELSAVNRSVVGSSPSVGATGPLEKWLNSYAFHAYIHGFESRMGHHSRDTELIEDIGSVFSLFIIKNSPIFIFGPFLCLLGCRHFLIILKIFILGSVLICLEFKSHTRNLKSHTRNPELSIKKYTIFYDIKLTSNFDSVFAFKASFEVH